MKNNVLFLVCLVVIWIGCSSPDQKKGLNTASDNLAKSVMIDLPKTGEARLNASEFADTVMYIPLETNSKCFIRRITQLQLTDKYIFINGFDRILLFSRDGKFIRQIGRKGKGPGEYANIFGFALNQDTVYITSSGKRSVIKYTVNGVFVEEIPTSSQLAHFTISTDNSIAWYNFQGGKVVFFDPKLQKADTITVDYNVAKERSMYLWWDDFDTYFQEGDHRLLFSNYMSDTIWAVSNGKKEIGYILNLGSQLLPENYRVEYCKGDFDRFQKNAAPYQKINLFETSSFLFMLQKGWVDNYINSLYLQDRSDNTIQKYESAVIFDDLVSKQELTPDFTTNNCIVATISPTHLLEELKKGQKTGEGTCSPLWLKQLANVKENDNPILVIMPVKNKMTENNN